MTREDLILQITPVAQSVFHMPGLELTDDMSAADVETWTSLSFMQFLTGIEELYGFKFKMMELLKMKNMGAVIDATLIHLT